MSEQLDMWDEMEIDKSITTEDLDNAVTAMAESKSDYESKKKVSDEAHAIYQEKRAKLVSTLRAIKKEKYHVDDIGTVSVVKKLKVRTPSNPDDKGPFFKWLNENFGAEGFLTYVGVNYATLNRLYNEEFAKAKERGNADEFTIPGIDKPVEDYELRFRK